MGDTLHPKQQHTGVRAAMECSTGFVILAWTVIGWQAFLLLMALFEPALRYKIAQFDSPPIDSEAFLRTIEALTDAQVNHDSLLTVHTNGEQFYEAELEAIRKAHRSINLEAYIFQKGEVTRQFISALVERARAGIKVNVVLDAMGSFSTTKAHLKELVQAGGQVQFYHPFSWRSVARINNRSHRELLIIDGKTGFIGGAGFADHWLHSRKNHKRWRDTMVQVEGEVVCNLQATFAENWLESSEEDAQAQSSQCGTDAPGQTARKCRQSGHYRGYGSQRGDGSVGFRQWPSSVRAAWIACSSVSATTSAIGCP